MTQLTRNKLARINMKKYESGVLKPANRKITDFRSVTPYSLVAGHNFSQAPSASIFWVDREPRKKSVALEHICSKKYLLTCRYIRSTFQLCVVRSFIQA